MAFSRWWTETVAALGDLIPLPTLLLLLLAGGALTSLGWYWFPAWIPRRWPRLRHLSWRGRWRRLRARFRRTRPTVPAPASLTAVAPADRLPDLPPAALASAADRLAADGRYAEAVRERLRAMVRELVDRRVIDNRPEWTVTELAGAAVRARPAVDPPLRAAGLIFSDLWYGQRPARAEHDLRMRQLATELQAILGADRGGRP